MSMRLTSSLNAVRNDTGRVAFCGPTVLSAITGFSISRIEEAIHSHRNDPAAAQKIIEGTTAAEVRDALQVFGYTMDLVDQNWHLERKHRPTVWSWMQLQRSAFSHYILAIHTKGSGHWICIKGAKICDTHTGGKWVFATDGPHRGAKIMEIYRVRQIDGAALSTTDSAPLAYHDQSGGRFGTPLVPFTEPMRPAA
jgi:hypothetical protein